VNPTYPHPPQWDLTVLRCAYTLFHSNEELISRTMEPLLAAALQWYYKNPQIARKLVSAHIAKKQAK